MSELKYCVTVFIVIEFEPDSLIMRILLKSCFFFYVCVSGYVYLKEEDKVKRA